MAQKSAKPLSEPMGAHFTFLYIETIPKIQSGSQPAECFIQVHEFYNQFAFRLRIVTLIFVPALYMDIRSIFCGLIAFSRK